MEDAFLNILNSIPFLLFKPFIIVLLILHLLFSIVVVRQTKLMSKVVEAQISPAIYTISIIHLLYSVFLFIWVILFL